MTKEQRSAATARMRRYRAEAAKDQKTLDEFHAKQRAWNRAWRAMKAQDPVWLAAHRAKERARMKAYYAAHPDKKREQWHRFTEKHGVARRPVAHMAYAKKVVLAGKPYAPRFYLRKPDYVPVGASGLDMHSPWLINNITYSQRAYARELATRNGQFLTPVCVSRMMAQVGLRGLESKPGEIIRLSDPSCGSSVLLIEGAEKLLADGRACDISYVQLALLGYAAVVQHMDALAMRRISPDRFTPGWYLHVMPMRRPFRHTDGREETPKAANVRELAQAEFDFAEAMA